MHSNGLQLNPAKTEILWFTSSRRQIQIPQASFCVESATIALSFVVRDLSIYLDSNLNMTTHISKTVLNCFSVRRLIHSVRRSVSKAVLLLLSLVTALVLSRVDYGNAMLTGLPARQLCWLQSFLHAAAPIVFSGRKFNHVTPLLRELHWLRILEWITFKLSCLVFRSLNITAPVYLADSINRTTDVTTRRSLHSSSSVVVVVPVTRCSVQHDWGSCFPGCCCPCMEQSTIVCHVIVITVNF